MRDVALDRGELERECRNRLRQPGERLGLEALHVDLHEGRHAVFRDQRVERRDADLDAPVPDLALPAFGAFGGLQEVLRRGRDRRVVDIDPHFDLAYRRADRDRLDRHPRVAPVDQPQGLHQRRIGLAGHHARTEPPERRDAVTDMRADVEHEVTRCDEPGVQRIHRGAVMPPAVIDAQRADDAACGSEGLEHGQAARSAAASMAGSASLRRGAGGAFSSGSAPSPARISRRPTEGQDEITASGIDSAGPPAMNSA